MSEEKHTPGPWQAAKCGGAWSFLIGTPDQVVSHAYTNADADLISAAPDLLEALLASQNILIALYDAEQRKDAKKFLAERMTANTLAISKATGAA